MEKKGEIPNSYESLQKVIGCEPFSHRFDSVAGEGKSENPVQ